MRVVEGGGLVCESVGNADLLSDHFDSKQSWEAVDLPLICNPSPTLLKIKAGAPAKLVDLGSDGRS